MKSPKLFKKCLAASLFLSLNQKGFQVIDYGAGENVSLMKSIVYLLGEETKMQAAWTRRNTQSVPLFYGDRVKTAWFYFPLHQTSYRHPVRE